MNAPLRPCSTPNCTALVERGKCPQCSSRRNRQNDALRPSSSGRGYDATWQRFRKLVLAAEPLCRHCASKGRVVAARDVDHIRPLADGGERLDWDNVQPLCGACHKRKTMQESVNQLRTVSPLQRPTVTLVCGPPGAGKSTYVRRHATPGDLVLDFDALMSALTLLETHRKPEHLLPFGWEARDAILAKLERATAFPGRVWLIDPAPERARRDAIRQRFHAELVLLATPAEVCLQRIAVDPARHGTHWPVLVRDWWSKFEPEDQDGQGPSAWGGE